MKDQLYKAACACVAEYEKKIAELKSELEVSKIGHDAEVRHAVAMRAENKRLQKDIKLAGAYIEDAINTMPTLPGTAQELATLAQKALQVKQYADYEDTHSAAISLNPHTLWREIAELEADRDAYRLDKLRLIKENKRLKKYRTAFYALGADVTKQPCSDYCGHPAPCDRCNLIDKMMEHKKTLEDK